MNRNLGNYDMVLSLSTSKINHHFKLLRKRKIIHPQWCFLTNSMGKEVKHLSEEEIKTFWNNQGNEETAIKEKEAELAQLQKDMDAAIDSGNMDQVKAINDKKKAIKAEIEHITAAKEKYKLYDLGMMATINAPQIYLDSRTPKQLIFQIGIESGTLFFERNQKRVTYDLKDITYAFTVSIGQIEINNQAKVVNDDGNITTLEQKGINSSDFTIRSLFLDFENANITDYNQRKSNLTQDIEVNNLLQATLGNYFRGLASSENPYILGYGIEKRQITESEKPMFYPTGASYSASASTSEQERVSAFNFLMLLNNHEFPITNDAGVLPYSLMKYAKDKSPTVNAVFGINLQDFKNNYVNKLSSFLAPKIGEEIRYNFPDNRTYPYGLDIRTEFSRRNIRGNNSDKTIDFKGILTFEYAGFKNSDQGVSIYYNLNCDGHIDVTDRDYLKKLEVGSITMRWKFSTHGRAGRTEGRRGLFSIELKTDRFGKLKLEPNYDHEKYEMRVGLLSEQYETIRKTGLYNVPGIGFFLDIINRLLDAIFQNEISNSFQALNNIQGIDDHIGLENLTNMESRVILPISSVYTYKNIRLLESSSHREEDNLLLLDATYGVQN